MSESSFESVRNLTSQLSPMAFSTWADSSHSTLHSATSSFENSCNDTEGRPRKRARSQTPVKEQEDLNRSEGFPVFQHDPDYYFEDGSTVIRVEDVLFKVHRTILSKDSSAFETMFKLPCAEDTQAEGGENNPVVLQGDTPEEFRSLLWALYAMPHEIVQAGASNNHGDWPEFGRFCNLTLMVHKYCFKSLETWALGTILRWLAPSSRHHPPRIHTFTAMSLTCTCAGSNFLEQLRQVLELAVLCDDQTLHHAVVQRLQDELRSADADLPWFIALGERFELYPLLGPAYYALMIQGREKWISLTSEGRLTRGQLAKLHNGYYALVHAWERYRTVPPMIQQCAHFGHCCKQRWHGYWKELSRDDIIMSKFPADVLGRLDTMLSRVYAYTGIMDMHQECRSRALGAVRSLIKETKEGLASHFVDLP
ncbi:hypothetical protein JB92DRAFT_2979214 [Gautieria morchelliformis]|nr:hypothetical protein JB92DRAFT_2979214 [Gautieria morchelliformis]